MTASVDLTPLVEAARAAIDATGAHTVTFDLAGRTIRLVGAGPALLDQVAPAFAHLPRGDDDDADLTVWLFDTASTGQTLPELAGALPAVGEAVAPLISDGGRSFVLHAFERSVSFLDHTRGLGVHAVADAAEVPPWERACPLRALLTWWFAGQGLLLCHGAAVGSPDGAVLLAGPGGAGKSTTALACFAAGLGYLGDDYVLVDPTTRTVWSVYGSAKLAPDHLARFPALLHPSSPQPTDPVDAKAVGWPLVARPEATVHSAPVRAVVVPVVTDAAVATLAPAPASRALMAIAPLTMFQTPGDRRAAFDLATDLSRAVPAWALRLGGDPAVSAELLSGLLHEAASPPGERSPR